MIFSMSYPPFTDIFSFISFNTCFQKSEQYCSCLRIRLAIVEVMVLYLYSEIPCGLTDDVDLMSYITMTLLNL